MSRAPLDPDHLPDDADTAQFAAYVGEDVGRMIVLRVAALLAVVCLVAGALSESASSTLRTACFVAGGAGVTVLVLAQLFRLRRSRQWVVILGVLVLCGGVLGAVFVGSRT